MAVTGHLYTRFSLSLATGLVDLTGDALKLMLLDTYTVGTTQDDAQFLADVLAVATETVGTGYTAGGKLIAAQTFTETGHVYALDSATDPAWTGATFSPGPAYAVLYDSTPSTDATRPVIGYFDLDGPNPISGGTFKLAINASGLLTMTAS